LQPAGGGGDAQLAAVDGVDQVGVTASEDFASALDQGVRNAEHTSHNSGSPVPPYI
jgi:hypothetical protein